MTAILPVVAPGGAKAVICVSELTVNDAVTPLKVTAVAPLKTAPVMVTEVLTGPLVGVKPLIVGAGMTVKSAALVAVPSGVVTAILPVVAPAGTMAVICVAELTVKDAVTPLKVTLVAPVRFVPLTATDVLAGPLVGVKPVTVGTAPPSDPKTRTLTAAPVASGDSSAVRNGVLSR